MVCTTSPELTPASRSVSAKHPKVPSRRMRVSSSRCVSEPSSSIVPREEVELHRESDAEPRALLEPVLDEEAMGEEEAVRARLEIREFEQSGARERAEPGRGLARGRRGRREERRERGDVRRAPRVVVVQVDREGGGEDWGLWRVVDFSSSDASFRRRRRRPGARRIRDRRRRVRRVERAHARHAVFLCDERARGRTRKRTRGRVACGARRGVRRALRAC